MTRSRIQFETVDGRRQLINPARRAMRKLMRECGVTSGRQKVRLRKSQRVRS